MDKSSPPRKGGQKLEDNGPRDPRSGSSYHSKVNENQNRPGNAKIPEKDQGQHLMIDPLRVKPSVGSFKAVRPQGKKIDFLL